MDALNQVLLKLKGNLTPFIIMLSFGFILYACSETQNPVAGTDDTEDYSLQSQLSEYVDEYPKNAITISGFIYVDANENTVKNDNETGISNVRVDLIIDNQLFDSQLTIDGGYYNLTVPVNRNIAIVIPEISNSSSFNEQLFGSFNATSPTSITLEVSEEDITNQNFGFVPDVDVIISQFSSGQIELDTEDFRFWRNEYLLAINSVRSPGRANSGLDIPAMNETATDLLKYLEEIEDDFLLPDIFNFGSNKLQTAYKMLQTPARTESQKLCLELLTAELNIVSGRGSGSKSLDLSIASFGEFFAAEGNLCITSTNTSKGNMLMSNSVTETLPFTMTSSATTLDGITLLSSFNRSGTGGGGVGN